MAFHIDLNLLSHALNILVVVTTEEASALLSGCAAARARGAVVNLSSPGLTCVRQSQFQGCHPGSSTVDADLNWGILIVIIMLHWSSESWYFLSIHRIHITSLLSVCLHKSSLATLQCLYTPNLFHGSNDGIKWSSYVRVITIDNDQYIQRFMVNKVSLNFLAWHAWIKVKECIKVAKKLEQTT